MSMAPRIRLLALPLLLGACATAPVLDSSQVDRSLTPALVTAEPDYATDRQVLWGGIILGTTNLPDRTLIEMLAYPLDRREKPQRDEAPLGRFLLEQSGFLDPAIYTAGRLLSVTGSVVRTETGKVGESEQAYPVVSAQALHLWPEDSLSEDPTLFFGIGVGFGF